MHVSRTSPLHRLLLCTAVLTVAAVLGPTTPPAVASEAGLPTRPSHHRTNKWPIGDVEHSGGTVSWHARRAKHASFRHATRFWGAATTKIRIRGAHAPHTYAFHLRLPAHVRLQENRFGEVIATRHGHKVGILGKPWAEDAHGHRVRTSYSLRGRVVKQHVWFNRHSTFPITADPWWNPFSWKWGAAFSVVWDQVRTCGRGAIDTIKYLAGPTVIGNILLKHVAGRAAVMVPGGAYAYAGVAIYGCLGSYF